MTPTQQDRIVSIIDAADDLTIATVRDDGWPQATTVSFVNDGLSIYFGTSAQSQKARNIARNDKVSVTVDLPYASWDDIKGLSIGGWARRVTEPLELQKVFGIMVKKFPQVAQYMQGGSADELAIFRIDPRVVSILDYAKGFGHTELVRM